MELQIVNLEVFRKSKKEEGDCRCIRCQHKKNPFKDGETPIDEADLPNDILYELVPAVMLKVSREYALDTLRDILEQSGSRLHLHVKAGQFESISLEELP